MGVSENEAANVPATTPFTIAVANASGYADDLGVYYANGSNAGGRLTRVTTPSAVGQYSVNLATGMFLNDPILARGATRLYAQTRLVRM